MLPLEGVKVLDLGRIYQGPWCGLMLALAGADVLKIEEPAGEPSRRGSTVETTTVPFAMLNSNKRDITLNLKDKRGRDLFRRLVEDADVVVENFSPGTMDRLGLSAESLLELNPRLVYGAATGYGIDGPDRDQLAMDITIQAHSGVMSVTGFPEQPPVKAGVAFVDFLGGTHLYAGIVTALYERERTGVGRIVDIAMIDTIYPTLASNLSGYFRDGFAGRAGNGHGGGALVPYNVYATADGHVAIIIISDQQWRNLCGAMGQPELVDDERFSSNGRRFHRLEELDDIIETWTSARSRRLPRFRLLLCAASARSLRTNTCTSAAPSSGSITRSWPTPSCRTRRYASAAPRSSRLSRARFSAATTTRSTASRSDYPTTNSARCAPTAWSEEVRDA